MRAVIAPNSAIATNVPPGRLALMLEGQSTDGRTNQARNESRPCHGTPMSMVAEGSRDRPNAVSHTIPTVRYARAAASRSRPTRATFCRTVAR
jgi:hypothetical protein